MSMTSEARHEIEHLLRQGQKARAIQYVVNAFHVSMEEASLLVDAAEQEMNPAAPSPSFSSSAMLTGANRTEVLQLLREHKMIEAIQYVQQKYSPGLQQAKRLVEDVQQELGTGYIRFPQNNSPGKVFRILLIVFGFVSFILLSIAASIYIYKESTFSPEHQTEGIVVSLHQTSNRTFFPVIEYTWRGKAYTYTSNVSSYPPAYEVNEKVMLMVNPEHPEEVLPDTFSERWLAITIIAGIGLFMLILAVIFFFVSRRF